MDESYNETGFDGIRLSLPFKAEYVSIARLTASGVANRIGFDMEIIEDIKVAVAEVCNKFVGADSKTAGYYNILFMISPKRLGIIFECEDENLNGLFDETEDELGISIINALMDEVEFINKNTQIIGMYKKLEGNIP
jgi:serine/threonine-protein kinase RsbW